MKKSKSALIILAIVLLLSVLLYFVPLKQVLTKIPLIRSIYKNTQLEIITPNGKSNIYINGKEYGQTPATITDLVEGTYEVTLERESPSEDFYKSQEFAVNMTRNTTSRINIEIGPDEYLYGSIIYYSKENIKSEKELISITSNTQDAKIYLDDEYLKGVPISNFEINPGEYRIKVTAQGYKSVEVPVIVRAQNTINIHAYLLPIPVTFEEVINE